MPLTRLAIFLAVMVTLTASLHYYLWARLVRDPALPPPWFRVATWAIVALAVLLPATMALARALPRRVVGPVSWVAYGWLGVVFFLLVLLVPVDLFRAAAALVQKLATRADVDPARRQFLARVVGGGVAAGALVLAGTALVSGLRAVAVARVRVALRGWPAAKRGYTIVQLTDVHVGPTIGREFVESLVAKVNALEPDLVAITGDLVDGSVEELGALVAPLANLRARDGVYFVTGNHEYYSGADAWIAHLGTLGVRVLRNERVAIGGADGFDLAGVDDSTAHQFGDGHGEDVPRALAGRDPARPVVLLAHQPRAVQRAAAHGVALQLSGHTHGGQMFPFNYLVKLAQPYVAGLHRHGDTQVYVSRGTGYWGPPMRLGAPAEITRIEIAPA